MAPTPARTPLPWHRTIPSRDPEPRRDPPSPLSLHLARSGPTAAAALLLGLGLLLLIPGAAAHAFVTTSEPGDGDQLDVLPEEVVLYYTEGVQQATVRVLDQNNQRIDTGRALIGSPDNSIVRVPLLEDAGGDGIYTLRWQVLADDGHITSGSFFWIVGDAEPDRETLLALFGGDADDGYAFYPMEAALRGVLLTAVVALVGVPLAHRYVLRPTLRGTPDGPDALAEGDTRARAVLLIASGLVLLVATLLALFRIHNAYGGIDAANLQDFVGTGLGRTWILQSLAALTALIVLGFVHHPARLIAPLGAGLIAGWTIASGSHSATLTGHPVGFLIDLGHILGASLWAGGLIALVLIAGPVAMARPAPWDRRLGAGFIARFSILALLGLGLATASGFVMAAWHVPDAASMGSTLYGATLTLKLVLILGAIALGSLVRLYVLRRLDADPPGDPTGTEGRSATVANVAMVSPLASASAPGMDDTGATGPGTDPAPTTAPTPSSTSSSPSSPTPAQPSSTRPDTPNRSPLRLFRRIAGTEAILLVLVLLASGLMTTAPTGVAAAHEGPELGPVMMEQTDRDLNVRLEVFPSRVGLNVFDIHVTDPDGAPAEVRDMLLLLRHPREDVALDPIEVEHVEDALWSSVGALSLGGVWAVRVQFWSDAGFHAPRFHIPVPTPAMMQTFNDAATPPPIAEPGPFQQLLWMAAALAALVAVAALLTEAVNTKRRGARPPTG